MNNNILFPKISNRKLDDKYTQKINTIIYEPKNNKPHISQLVDQSKTNKLIKKIKESSIREEEKLFLIEAAKRHNVFDYSKIADYYAHSSKEMQELMEDSALVIIDFKKAIEQGYVNLSKNIADAYKKEKDISNEK
jgi:hypothetical protein